MMVCIKSAALGMLALFGICFTQAQRKPVGQKSYVNFVNEYPKPGTINRLEISHSKLERVNNRLNLAFTFADGAQLQLNGISQSWLKDTSGTTANVRLVYINANQNQTLSSKKSIRLRIQTNSLQTGTPIRIYALGKVTAPSVSNTFELQFIGAIPPNESQTQH